MIARSNQRRGLVLVMMVIVIGVVAGFLALLAMSAAHRYREHEAERARLICRMLSDSAAAHARAHQSEWSQNPPAEPVELDVADLLPPQYTGSATLTFTQASNETTCQVNTRVQRGRYACTTEFDLR